MHKPLIRALMVLRLELQQLPVDWQLVLLLWRQRPVVEEVHYRREDQARRAARGRLCARLDEVYPF